MGGAVGSKTSKYEHQPYNDEALLLFKFNDALLRTLSSRIVASTDEFILSRNPLIPHHDIAVQITNDMEGIKKNANLLFHSRSKNETVIPMEGAFIVHLCLQSHRFSTRILADKVVNDMSNKTLELISESTNGNATIVEINTILQSICVTIEKSNTLWE